MELHISKDTNTKIQLHSESGTMMNSHAKIITKRICNLLFKVLTLVFTVIHVFFPINFMNLYESHFHTISDYSSIV